MSLPQSINDRITLLLYATSLRHSGVHYVNAMARELALLASIVVTRVTRINGGITASLRRGGTSVWRINGYITHNVMVCHVTAVAAFNGHAVVVAAAS